jgi:pyruvate,water dikinase
VHPVVADPGPRSPYVRHLIDLGHRTIIDGSAVGRLAIELASQIRAGGSIAPGFVVTTGAFRQSMVAAGVRDELGALVAAARLGVVDGAPDRARPHELMVELIRTAGPSPEVVTAIANAYPALGIEDLGPARVVVRTSPVGDPVPDLPVPVRGLRAVLDCVVSCWVSVFEPAAVATWTGPSVPETAVVVQALGSRVDPLRSRADCREEAGSG